MNILEPKLAVHLPAHDYPGEEHYCFRCGEKMDQCTASMVYKFKSEKVRVTNIQLFRCGKCRENIYNSEEAEMIEYALRKAWEEKNDSK
jgi:YgiT-type zinc finger domain-containing protein